MREAAIQVASALQETLRRMQVDQQTLLLEMGYTAKERYQLAGRLAENLLHSGVSGVPALVLQESVGLSLLAPILFTLLYEGVDEMSAHIRAVTLLERNMEFRRYVRTYPPITLGTRRDREPPSPEPEADADLPEVHEAQRIYYRRAVSSRTRRTLGRSGWRQPGPMYGA